MGASRSRPLFWVVRIPAGSSLLLAAVGKAADLSGFSRRLTAMGCPETLSPLFAGLIVLAEGGIGTGWLVLGDRPIVWKAGIGLLALLSAGEGWRTLLGLQGDCGCFGVWFTLQPWQAWAILLSLLSASLYGWRVTTRSSPPAAPRPPLETLPRSPTSPFIPSTALLLAVVLTNLVAPEVIVLNLQSLWPQVPPLPLGSRAPAFRLNDDAGHTIANQDLYGHPYVLLFLSSCGDCSAGTVRMWDQALVETGIGRCVILAPERPDRLRAFRDKYRVKGILLSTLGTDVPQRYRVSQAPMVYVVNAEGKVIFALKPEQDTQRAIEQVVRILNKETAGSGFPKPPGGQ